MQQALCYVLSREPGTHNTIGLHTAENQSEWKKLHQGQPVALLAVTTTAPSLLHPTLWRLHYFFVLTSGSSEDELKQTVVKIQLVFALKMQSGR